MNPIRFINTVFGLYLSIAWVYAFAIILSGYSIYEPVKSIIIAEISFASLVFAWFIVQIFLRHGGGK